MDGELTGLDAVSRAGRANEPTRELGVLTARQHPTDDVSAENIEHDVQVVVRPLLRAEQLCNVPSPHLIYRPRREQFGLRIQRVAKLISTCSRTSRLPARIRYIVRGDARYTPSSSSVAYTSVGASIAEALRVQRVEYALSFGLGECSCRATPPLQRAMLLRSALSVVGLQREAQRAAQWLHTDSRA